MAAKRMKRYVELMEKLVAEHEGQSGRAASFSSGKEKTWLRK